jgi:serine phosphatase RsbU (regulator of sigma subunit)/anti-sigma regulatory factor (Ser/Thr protein kinase)
MKVKHKPRLLLIYRIGIIFILAFFVAVSCVYTIGKNILIVDTIDDRSDVARSALMGAWEVIWNMDKDLTLFEDQAMAGNIRKEFREICRETGLRYLYLYTVDDEGVLHYYIAAARTNDDDEIVKKAFGYGATQERDLYEAEKIALTGNPDCQLNIVKNRYGYVCSWITPLLKRDGEVVGLLAADYDMTLISKIAGRTLKLFAVVGFAAFCITFFLAISFIRISSVKPLKNLAARMALFAKEKKIEKSTRRTLFRDEITDIENSFNSMAAEMEQYIGHIEELTKERIQNQTQMEVARRIQYGVVPETLQKTTDRFEIFGSSRPAKEVGGDFYDFFELSDGRIAFVEGDVSGKGISAALFMMMMKSSIREKIRSGMDPATALNEVNDQVCASNPESMFATVFAGVFDFGTCRLTFANAGHNPPIIIGEQIKELSVDSGIALGLFEDSGIISDSVYIGRDNGIVVYTDGVTEAINGSDEQFGIDRTLKAIEKGKNAADVVQALTGSVNSFAQGLEQFDDMTAIAFINRLDPDGTINLLPIQKEFDKIKNVILEKVKDTDLAKRIALCCEEIFTNIVNYSGADKASFKLTVAEGITEAVLKDNGVAFDPLDREKKDLEFDELDSGGMGIILVRENCREMLYERKDDLNILTMRF